MIDNAVYEYFFIFRNKNWIIRLSVNKKDIDGSTTVVEMANVKTTLTNVPFFKGNRFDYRQLLWFIQDNSGNLIWLIFIPVVILIVTAVSNAANLTDGID